MCSAIYWCFPPYLPGFVEAGLHSIYTGFFIIEAATYGLHLEQKFHGVLQILLINFYIVLLCILFLRWHISRHKLGCHLFISLTSCTLTMFIGQMILMYLEHMETISGQSKGQLGSTPTVTKVMEPLKMDLIVLILDIFFYLLITSSYIILLLRISLQLHKASRIFLYGDDYDNSGNNSPSNSNNTVYTVSTINTTGNNPRLTSDFNEFSSCLDIEEESATTNYNNIISNCNDSNDIRRF